MFCLITSSKLSRQHFEFSVKVMGSNPGYFLLVEYICGDKISVADIVACCELEQSSMAGYDVTEGRPVLKEYMERVKSELQPHYDDVHTIVYQMCKKFGGKIPGLEIQGAKL